jgi:hypothetical protein
MTTIVCNKMVMVADSCFHEDGIAFSCVKLHRVGHSIFGLAGETRGEYKFLEWIRGGKRADTRPTFEGDMDEFYALELNSAGIFYWDKHLFGVEAKEPFLAIGSGGDFARAFMVMGLSPQQAVQKVCDTGLDYASRGPIQVELLTEEGTDANTQTR